jgi:hypothetical protein
MMPLEVAMEWHLTGNFYPPMPLSLVVPCCETIRGAEGMDPDSLDEYLDELVTMPGPYGNTITRRTMVDALHLETMVYASAAYTEE